MYFKIKPFFILLTFLISISIQSDELTFKQVQRALEALGLPQDFKPKYDELYRIYRLSSDEKLRENSRFLLENYNEIPDRIEELQEKEGEELLEDILWLEKRDDIEGIKRRLPYGGEHVVNTRFENGDTLLIYFARKRQAPLIREILQRGGVYYNLTDRSGKTAMMIASENDDEPSLEAFASRRTIPLPTTNTQLNKKLSQLFKEHPRGSGTWYIWYYELENRDKARWESVNRKRSLKKRPHIPYRPSEETKKLQAKCNEVGLINSKVKRLISIGARPTADQYVPSYYTTELRYAGFNVELHNKPFKKKMEEDELRERKKEDEEREKILQGETASNLELVSVAEQKERSSLLNSAREPRMPFDVRGPELFSDFDFPSVPTIEPFPSRSLFGPVLYERIPPLQIRSTTESEIEKENKLKKAARKRAKEEKKLRAVARKRVEERRNYNKFLLAVKNIKLFDNSTPLKYQ